MPAAVDPDEDAGLGWAPFGAYTDDEPATAEAGIPPVDDDEAVPGAHAGSPPIAARPVPPATDPAVPTVGDERPAPDLAGGPRSGPVGSRDGVGPVASGEAPPALRLPTWPAPSSTPPPGRAPAAASRRHATPTPAVQEPAPGADAAPRPRNRPGSVALVAAAASLLFGILAAIVAFVFANRALKSGSESERLQGRVAIAVAVLGIVLGVFGASPWALLLR